MALRHELQHRAARVASRRGRPPHQACVGWAEASPGRSSFSMERRSSAALSLHSRLSPPPARMTTLPSCGRPGTRSRMAAIWKVWRLALRSSRVVARIQAMPEGYHGAPGTGTGGSRLFHLPMRPGLLYAPVEHNSVLTQEDLRMAHIRRYPF